jgi:hypothetical protein
MHMGGGWGWNIAELENFFNGVLTSWKTTDGFGDAGGALSPEHRNSVPDRWAGGEEHLDNSDSVLSMDSAPSSLFRALALAKQIGSELTGMLGFSKDLACSASDFLEACLALDNPSSIFPLNREFGSQLGSLSDPPYRPPALSGQPLLLFT